MKMLKAMIKSLKNKHWNPGILDPFLPTKRALNIYHSGLAGVMGFGIPQEDDSDSANGSIFAPMKSGQPQWIYAHEAMLLALPLSLVDNQGALICFLKNFLRNAKAHYPCQTL